MTRARIGLTTLLALIALTVPAAAQELEVFSLDDFIRPGDLERGGQDLWFVAARALVGFDHHYTHRNDVLGQDVGFGRVLVNLYHSGWQLNVNGTRFSVDPSDLRERYSATRVGGPVGTNLDALPVSRIGIETSRYFGDTEEDSARVRFKWSREELMSSAHQDEYGVDLELKIPELEVESVGGLQYLYRPALQQHVIGFGYRQNVFRSSNGFSVLLGEGFGGEVTGGDWRFGLFRFQAGVAIPIPVLSTYVHLVGSAARVPRGQDVRANQTGKGTLEGAVFINLPLFAKLSSPRDRAAK